MHRLISLAATTTMVAAFAFSANAQEVPARIKAAGKIVIATNPNYPPITFKDPATNTLSGLDIDIGEAIGRELGLKVEWQEIAFAQMLPALQTGRVDAVLAWMSDTPQRREVADFINYAFTGAQFYTVTALGGTIKTPTDLCGKQVGASRSTTWPKDIEEWSKVNCIAKGLAPITPVGTEGSVDARAQLKTQRLQGAVHGSEVMSYFVKLEPNTYVPLGQPFTQKLVGMPFAKTPEGVELREAVRGALNRLQIKGDYSRLLEKYGLRDNVLTPITVNQGT